LILVLSGSMTLRSPEGFEVVTQGQLVFFEIGETGAHQFYNHGAESCTYLDLRITIGLDVCEYPDSEKLIQSRQLCFTKSRPVLNTTKAKKMCKQFGTSCKMRKTSSN
jgi:uncharacterized cupin superfamily protein